MRILFLNQTFYPDVVATAQQASDLAVKLVERGHDVTIVCSRRAYDSPLERYSPKEVWRGVYIRRISSLGFGKRARWRRTADFGSYMVSCCIHLASLPRFDLVIAMTSPPLISWLGAWFATIKGCRFLFWVMDLNPDEALAAGWLRPDSWTTKGLATMLSFGLRRATTIVALDRFMARRIAEKGVPSSKIVILPPWPHSDGIRHDTDGRIRFRKEHGLDGKHVVMYAGNHSPCHPLKTVLEAARQLEQRTDVVFCFVGGGSELETVRHYASEYELRNVLTLPYQPVERLAATLSSADLHVVVMGDPFVGIVHPCKVYNISALGIPYLYIGPTESHISELRPTFAATHGDVAKVVGHIVTSAGMRWSPASDSMAITAGHDGLVARMVAAVEDTVLAPTGHRRRIVGIEQV